MHHTKTTNKVNKLVWIYFFLAYLFSWTIEIPLALTYQGLTSWHIPQAIHYLASYGPFLSAVLLTCYSKGFDGIKHLFGKLTKWHIPLECWIFTILTPVIPFLFSLGVIRITNDSWPDLSALGQPDYLPWLGFPLTLLLWTLTYGLGEEIGWRGFALPHLQKKYPALSSTIILTFLWGFWHLPAFFYRDTYINMGLFPGLPIFLISLFFASMIFTWLYNASNGSLLVVVVFHGLFNWLSTSNIGNGLSSFLMTFLVVLWGIRVMRSYDADQMSPIPRQVE